ncbi:ABC transporter substrate-binding protein [Tistrella bauzanensis]
MAAIAADPKVKLISLPVTNSFRFVAFNTRTAPFDDVRVRQAIAWALPYEDMFQGAIFGRGMPLYGAASAAPEGSAFPQPYPYQTDLDRARALLAEAGLGDGFETTFSYNVADAVTADPIALLVQEQLGRIGIKVTIEKVPTANWGTLLTEKGAVLCRGLLGLVQRSGLFLPHLLPGRLAVEFRFVPECGTDGAGREGALGNRQGYL